MLYTGLILLFKYESCRPYLRISLLLILSIEIGYMNVGILKNRNALPKDTISVLFNTKNAVDTIKVNDKEFFRINKNPKLAPVYELIYNNAKLEGYYGTSCYDSFNQKYYIRFLEEMGIIEEGDEWLSRYSIGLMSQPLLWSFASIKYYIGLNTDYSTMMLMNYEPLKMIKNIILYKNNHFLPLGYTYDHFIPISEFRKLTQLQKELTIYKAFVAEEPIDDTIKKN